MTTTEAQKTTHNILWMNLTNGFTILTEYIGKHDDFPGVSMIRNPILIDESDSEGVGFSEYMGGKEYNVIPINNASIIATTMANDQYKDLYFEILADIAKSLEEESEKMKATGEDTMNEIPEPESQNVQHQQVNNDEDKQVDVDVYKDYDPAKALEKSITVYFTNPESKTDENYLDILNRVQLPSGSKPS